MKRFLSICYEGALWTIALLAVPKTLYSFFVHGKYRESLLPRLGFRCPLPKTLSKPSIWIHAVSMGETKAIVSLARELKHRFPDHFLIISSTTETGHAEAKRSLSFADYHIYLPLDFRGLVNKVIKRARPKAVILCESDFWFNFLSQAKKQGAALILVSGKMSERSMRQFEKASFFAKPLFNLFDLACVQNPLYQTRFIRAGFPSNKIAVTGNLKLDETYVVLSAEAKQEWQQKLGIQPGQLVLTIGSSHAPEEEIFIHALKEIWKECPSLRVLLVPRHLERFKEVGLLLEQAGLSWINLSNIHQKTGHEQVILIDAMGLLRTCYQICDFAFVGGSFTDKVGGHNILEPCGYGKPVLFGPHMHTQLELVDLVKQYGAGQQIEPNQLQVTLQKWIQSPDECQNIGAKGNMLIKELKGSLQRTLQAVEPIMQEEQKCQTQAK